MKIIKFRKKKKSKKEISVKQYIEENLATKYLFNTVNCELNLQRENPSKKLIGYLTPPRPAAQNKPLKKHTSTVIFLI